MHSAVILPYMQLQPSSRNLEGGGGLSPPSTPTLPTPLIN